MVLDTKKAHCEDKMKVIQAQSCINKPKILRVTTSPILFNRSKYAFVTKQSNIFDFGYGAIISPVKKHKKNLVSIEKQEVERFHDGDIVEITKEQINFLWEYNNNDNSFFLTELCNCKCIMCPQPPKPHNKEFEEKALSTLALIPDDYKGDICLTGGEVTLLNDFFLDFLRQVRAKFKHNFITILTNGKSFSNFDFLNKFHAIQAKALVAISLTADVDTLHDEIVGAKKSFYQTHQGICNLGKACEAIELRIVVSRLNYARLPQIADYIYRNYPFVTRVVFVGMEYTGYASSNYEKIKINPVEYEKELLEAVTRLARYGMNVSVYNIPLCLLPNRIEKYSAKSISAWKNTYQEKCLSCTKREQCCGVFTTSNGYDYQNLTPFGLS